MGLLTDRNIEMGDPLSAIWSQRTCLIHSDSLAGQADSIYSMLSGYTDIILLRMPEIHSLTKMIMDHPDKEYYACHEACIPGYCKMNGANWISYTLDDYLQPLSKITPLSQYHTDMKYILSDLNSDDEWRKTVLGSTCQYNPRPDAYVGIQAADITIVWNLSTSIQRPVMAHLTLYFGRFSCNDVMSKLPFSNCDRLLELEYRIDFGSDSNSFGI